MDTDPPEVTDDRVATRERSEAGRLWPGGRAGWVVVGLGVAVRLLWSIVGTRPPKALADPLLYHQAAQHIANGDGYVSFYGLPTSYYPPGFPHFLGSVQWVVDRLGLSDSIHEAVGIVQSLMSGVAIAAIIVIGTRLGGRRTGLVAGAVFAFWPNLVLHSSLMLSETLFLTLLSVSLAATVTMVDDGGPLRRAHAAVAGLALGGATLVRPQVLVVPFALGVVWLLCRVPLRDVLRRAAVLAAGVVVVVAPWTIRNAVVLDAFVLVSTNDGDNLCVGFNPEATGHFGIPDACDTGEFYIDGTEAELRRQAETRRRALEFIREHPGRLPELTWKKLYYTYRSDDDALWASLSFGEDRWLSSWQETTLRAVGNVYYAVVMVAATLGAVLVVRRGWATRRDDPTPPAFVAATVASSLVPAMFFGDARFKVPSAPFYAVLAAVAVVALWERVGARRRRNGRRRGGGARPRAVDGMTPDTATTEPATDEPRPSPAGADADGEWTPTVRTAYWVAVALVAAVVVLAGVRAVAGDWLPTGDNAFLAMRSRAVFSSHPPLLSTASSAGAQASVTYNHPGPALLYLTSPATALLGSQGIALGVAVVNAAAVVTIGWMSRRAARPALAAVVLAAVGGIVWAMGSEVLVDPWNPHAATLPFAVLLVAAWAVWCRVPTAAPVGLAAGAAAAQTHLSFVPVSAVAVVALVAGVVVHLRGADGPTRRAWRAAGWWSAAAALVVSLPPLVEQVAHGGDGNLASILRGSDLDAVTVRASQSVAVLGTVLVRPPWFLRGSWDLPPFESDLLTAHFAVRGLAVLAAVSAVLALHARRRGDTGVTALLAVVWPVLVVGALAGTSFPLRLGIPVPYFRWVWPAAALLWAALLVPVGELAARRLARGGADRAAPLPAVAVAGVAAATAAAVLTVPAYGSDQAASQPWGQQLTRDVLAQAEDRLEQLDSVEVVASLQEGPLMAFTPALVDRLDELGVDVRSRDEVLVQQSGEHHRATGDEPWVLTMVGPDTSLPAGPPGGERLAVHRVLDDAAQRDLDDEVQQVAADLEGAAVVLTEAGRRTGDRSLEQLATPSLEHPELFLGNRVLAEALRQDLVAVTTRDGRAVDVDRVADLSERAFQAAGRTFALWLVPRDEWEGTG